MEPRAHSGHVMRASKKLPETKVWKAEVDDSSATIGICSSLRGAVANGQGKGRGKWGKQLQQPMRGHKPPRTQHNQEGNEKKKERAIKKERGEEDQRKTEGKHGEGTAWLFLPLPASPKVIVPRQMRLTRRPLFPRKAYSIAAVER